MISTFARPQIRHALPGRVRVHVPGWSGEGHRALERRLLLLRGVHSARANPLTATVLIHFDPGQTNEQTLLRALGGPEVPGEQQGLRPEKLVKKGRLEGLVSSQVGAVCFPRQCRLESGRFLPGRMRMRAEVWMCPGRIDPLRAAAVILRIGLLASQPVFGGKGALPGVRSLAAVAGVVAFVKDIPPFRDTLRRLLGPAAADLIFRLADAVALVLTAGPLQLAVAAVELLLPLLGRLVAPLLPGQGQPALA